MMNETMRFLGPESEWDRCVLELDDVHGLWGGRRMHVEGTGQVRVEIHPGATVYMGDVPKDRVAKVLRLAARVDVLGVPEPPPHTPVPDESSATVGLVSAMGQKRRRWCWARAPIPAVVAVYDAILDLEPLVVKGVHRPVRVFR